MHQERWRHNRTAATGKFLVGLLAFGVAQLHAGFIGTTCTDNYVTCTNANTHSTVTQGTTTFTFTDIASGGLVGGKPTLGSYAALEVADPNGVPTGPQYSVAYETFTDTIPISSAALIYTFTLDFHVINSFNSFSLGFPTVESELFLVVQARDASHNLLWSTSNVDFTPIDVNSLYPGSSDRIVTYSTNFFFYNPATASLDIMLTSTSLVAFNNVNPHTNATDVVAYSDASHTITLQTVQGQSFGGVPMGPALSGTSGANYSNVVTSTPEPQSLVLILLGAAPLILRARRRP